VAYHEAFWVVIGTAAPVVALAAVVAEGQVMRAVLDITTREDGTLRTRLSSAGIVVLAGVGFLVLCVFLQIAGFLDAVRSLAMERDSASTWRGILEITTGIFLLLLEF
jgi:hypothetical protein